MPPTPIWKMRSLLFLLTCARADSGRDARPAETIAPVRRKLRRVIGENEGTGCFVFIMARRNHASMSGRFKQPMSFRPIGCLNLSVTIFLNPTPNIYARQSIGRC